jgi:hypothetical protein
MASIIADIGDRIAPAADCACRRGPSRICIGISVPSPLGSRGARVDWALRPAPPRSQHGRLARDLRRGDPCDAFRDLPVTGAKRVLEASRSRGEVAEADWLRQ